MVSDYCSCVVSFNPKISRLNIVSNEPLYQAWVSKCPLLGDKRYDGGGLVNKEFQEDGFYLCSTEITLEHPYYNTELGRKEYNSMKQSKHNSEGDVVVWKDQDTDLIMVRAQIPLPDKFKLFTDREASHKQIDLETAANDLYKLSIYLLTLVNFLHLYLSCSKFQTTLTYSSQVTIGTLTP